MGGNNQAQTYQMITPITFGLRKNFLNYIFLLGPSKILLITKIHKPELFCEITFGKLLRICSIKHIKKII